MTRFVVWLACCLAWTLTAAAQEGAESQAYWPQWRGPAADGHAPLGDPPITWDAQTNIRWQVELPGEGSATPIVWQDDVYVAAAIKTDRMAPQPPADPRAKTTPPAHYYQFVILCLDRQTGAQRWRQTACEAVPHEGLHATNTYASASPCTDGQRLFVSFGSRGVFCFDLQGNLLWQHAIGPLRTRNGWGEGTSPVVQGGMLIVNCDQEENSFMLALDAATGELRWRVERDEPTSWATPLVVQHAGRWQVVANGAIRVRSYDLETGDVLWECGGQTLNAIPSPLAAGDYVYCMSGYRGAAAMAIPLSSQGDITDTAAIVWQHQRGTPYVPSPILVHGRLYFTAGNTDVLTCLDAASGEPVFEQQRLEAGNVYASPVAAAGRIYFTGRDGATVVLAEGPELKVLAINRLEDAIDASPAIAGRQMFLRGARRLYCLEEGLEEAGAEEGGLGQASDLP